MGLRSLVKSERYLLWIAVAAPLLMLSGCAMLPTVKLNDLNGREANANEMFYVVVAANFGDTGVCEKISNRAFHDDRADAGPPVISLTKSECYFHAALRTGNPNLCAYVTKVIAIPSNISYVSEFNCRQFIKEKPNGIQAPSFPYYEMRRLMMDMGYRDVDLEVLNDNSQQNPNGKWCDFYTYLVFRSSPAERAQFLQRASMMPSFDH